MLFFLPYADLFDIEGNIFLTIEKDIIILNLNIRNLKNDFRIKKMIFIN